MIITSSSTTLEEVNRKSRKSHNTFGDPIQLPSKLLAITPDPLHDDAVYVAESAATIKRIDLSTRRTTHTYRGPTAPLTSLCFSTNGTKLYAGCWDKLIYSWHVPSCTPSLKFQGHTDFVKSLVCVRTASGQDIFVSGGAEGDILIWDTQTSRREGVLKGGSHAIQDLALDPLSEDDLTLYTAFSDPGIRHFTLPNNHNLEDATRTLTLAFSPHIISAHDTSVYKLHFDSDGDLWTASADKTAKHLVRADDWKADTTLPHPDFVRDVIVHERFGWVITACRDEEVRVWNLATGQLHHTYSGHFEEVTGLCVVGDMVVSISIDATVRQWSLKPGDLQRAREEAVDPEKGAEQEQTAQRMENGKKQPGDLSALTEEEERELDELMEY